MASCAGASMSAEASWEEAVRSGLRATAFENRVAARDEVAELPSEPGVTACTECLLTEVAKAAEDHVALARRELLESARATSQVWFSPQFKGFPDHALCRPQSCPRTGTADDMCPVICDVCSRAGTKSSRSECIASH